MSRSNESRIAALEASILALGLRVQQLEQTVAVQNQKLTTETLPRAASPGLRPAAPVYRPSFTRWVEMSAPLEKSAASEQSTSKEQPPFTRWAETSAPQERSASKEQLAPREQSGAMSKSETKKTSTSSDNQSNLSHAKTEKALPNGAERTHIIFIQKLHADGKSKEEILNHTLDEFPDLYKVQGEDGEDSRKEAVRNTIQLHTSRWADKVI